MEPVQKPKAVRFQCRWYIYGCKYHYTTDKDHEDVCSRRPKQDRCDTLWRELVSHVRNDSDPILDILAALGPWARELKPVTFLSHGENPIQDFPYYLDVSSWWSDGIPGTESLQKQLLPSIKRQLGSEQCKRLIEQLRADSKHVAAEAVRVLNLATPRKMLTKFGLKVPPWVRIPVDQCLWNITPRHAYTDLHTDRGLDTVTFQVGGRKLWILYEPEPPATPTNKVTQRESKFFQLWAQHFKEASSVNDTQARTLLEIAGPNMRRPYIAVTQHQQGLFVPAGWKHAVFTVESGYLAGFSFCTHPHLEHHVNTLLREMEAAMEYQNPAEYDKKTDYLFPDLWKDLHHSFSYVLFHLTEIWQKEETEYTAAVEQLWPKLVDFLHRFVPAMKAKNGGAIKKYLKLASLKNPANRK
jgi:hypothetical protein